MGQTLIIDVDDVEFDDLELRALAAQFELTGSHIVVYGGRRGGKSWMQQLAREAALRANDTPVLVVDEHYGGRLRPEELRHLVEEIKEPAEDLRPRKFHNPDPWSTPKRGKGHKPLPPKGSHNRIKGKYNR